jgi:hypothetical protein
MAIFYQPKNRKAILPHFLELGVLNILRDDKAGDQTSDQT